MYSFEDRARAARLVVDEGLACREAVEALGYPASHSTVAAWARELRETGGLREGPRGGGVRARPPSDDDLEGIRVETGDDIGALEERKRQLEREIREAELALAVRRKALEILGKGAGADPATELTNREKAVLVRDLTGPDARQCDLLRAVGLARSTYNGQLRAMEAPDKYAGLRRRVAEVFAGSGGAYGYRRVKAVLDAEGERRSEKVIARIMSEGGMAARDSRSRGRRWSSYAGESGGAPPNLVGRDFRSGLPNFLWLTDITELKVPAGKLYLSAVLDCFDGRVAAWRTSASPDAALANGTLEDALAQRGGWEATVVHSDRGGHYRWPGWVSICEGAGLTRSMSRLGCSPDNAAMEGFFGRMKVEMFYGRDWSGATLEDLADAVDDYIGWYNGERVKVSLGGMSPDEYRRSLGLAA